MPADPTKVIAAARGWLGTPYHDQASVKGVGCDCLGLARGIWREVVGSETLPVPPYSRDWGEIGTREVLAENAGRVMIRIDPAEAGAGLVRLVLGATGAPDLERLRAELAAEAEACAARFAVA